MPAAKSYKLIILRNCGERVMRMDPPCVARLFAASIRFILSSRHHQHPHHPQHPRVLSPGERCPATVQICRLAAAVRLEAGVNSTMDYLSNEGLSFEDLFKKRAPNISVHKTMESIMSGVAIDFGELIDAPLACDVLHECLLQMSKPAYPSQLVYPLHEAFRASKSDPPEQQHETAVRCRLSQKCSHPECSPGRKLLHHPTRRSFASLSRELVLS
jgi:hypothetical protein